MSPCRAGSASIATSTPGHVRFTAYRTIPHQIGPEHDLHILESFAKHVSLELGWTPNIEGPVKGYPL